MALGASLARGKCQHFLAQVLASSGRVLNLDETRTFKRPCRLQIVARVGKRPPLRRGKVSPCRPVPEHIPRPPYVGSPTIPEISRDYQMHDSKGIYRMRAACALAAQVLDYSGTLVKSSITTDDIDEAVHQMIISAGAYPSPLGYGGFPKSVCTSVNECMFHGIPDSRKLQSGDIINIDVAVYLDGYHGDTSKTFLCGDVSDEMKRLVKVTEECLERGIAVCKDGATFKQIGQTIREHAEKHSFEVERFIGHGVGTVLHSQPLIFYPCNEDPPSLGCMLEGQTFTIEPVVSMGSVELMTWPDKWTVVTADGSPSAQFEHTVLITKYGVEVLTTTSINSNSHPFSL
ncbi:methionine aminopeptidase 1B, chloroplastic-like isoform X2 [Momordica charantia]|uniref:Methionine aminopeptidase n=1 Tax=Momordica charantia TaxID=3673 RepID=A0A6J1DMC4_MOMCH|nr:methionine aminopeptidase 1B, chloroplastic-like isoform X2 [Momordica charantia]